MINRGCSLDLTFFSQSSCEFQKVLLSCSPYLRKLTNSNFISETLAIPVRVFLLRPDGHLI